MARNSTKNRHERIRKAGLKHARMKPLVASTGTGKATSGFTHQMRGKGKQSKPTPAGNWQGKI